MPEEQEKEISNPDRIRRIIGILRLDGREIELHFPQYIEVVKITDTTQESFTVKISDNLINLQEENVELVPISFVYSGVELFGKCRFREQTRSFIILEYPDSLKSRVKRVYPRIKLKETVPAKLKYKQFPEMVVKTITSKDLPVQYSQIYWEAQRESVDIKKLFLLIGKEVKNISPYSEIVLYNKDNVNTRDARILRKSGKILFVDDCKKVASYTRFIPSDSITNYSYYIDEKKIQGVSKEELLAELNEVIKEDLSQDYSSKVILPIFFDGEVIGHIKAFRKGGNSRITLENVTDLRALSLLLTMGIEKARFIPDLDQSIDSSLVDISEGGLLIKIMNGKGGVHIPEGAPIEVKFVLKQREITLKGNVARKDDQTFSYAIRFSDLNPEEKQAVRDFIEENFERIKEDQ